MKKVYEHPQVIVEEFAPNEYIAACGSGIVYKFKCDAGGGARGDVYTNAGKNLTSGERRYYHACSKTHEADTKDEFISGYYIQNGGNDKTQYYDGWKRKWVDYSRTPVIIWTDHGTNVHCTTDLNQKNWETAKS